MAYRFNSQNDVSIAVLVLVDPSGVKAKTYQIGQSAARAEFGYVHHIDSLQAMQVISGTMSLPLYVLTSGSATIMRLTASNIQGTFSGSGAYSTNSGQTISVSDGQFNAELEYASGLRVGPFTEIVASLRETK